MKEEDDKGDDNDEDDGEDEHSGCEEVEGEEGGPRNSFSAIDEDSSTESVSAEPEPEEDAGVDKEEDRASNAMRMAVLGDENKPFLILRAKDFRGFKGSDKHRALCDQVSKGLADIIRKIPDTLGEVCAQKTSYYGLIFCWDVAIKEDSGFTAAELSEEAGNVGLYLSHEKNTVTFVAPLTESTVEVADALFKFKKAVLNQKLAAMAKAGTWVKKKGEALDSCGGDEWDSDDASFGGRDQGGASNENCIDESSDGEKDSEEWGEDACISDVGKDDGDFMQAIAASIADLKVATNHEIEGPNTNKVDVSMPVPDVSDELDQKPSSLEEKDALDRACKENEANTFSILNAGPHGFGENI